MECYICFRKKDVSRSYLDLHYLDILSRSDINIYPNNDNLSFIKDHPDVIDHLYWNGITHQLIKDYDKPLQYIEKYIEFPWNFQNLYEDKIITLEFIKKYPTLNYDWRRISRNEDLEMIEKYIDLPWIWEDILVRFDLDLDFIVRHKDKIRNLKIINPDFKMRRIKKLLKK